MSDSIRKEFEKFAAIRHAGEELHYHAGLFERSADGTYALYWLEQEWVIWQASREWMVIELPRCHGGYGSERMFKSDVVAAIHAAGIKTK